MGSRSLFGRCGMATWVTFACGFSGIFGEITYPAIQHGPHGNTCGGSSQSDECVFLIPLLKTFPFPEYILKPFLLLFFKKIFLSITTLLETEKFDSAWRSNPADGNTVRREFLLEEILPSGKLRQLETPTRELFR